MPPDTRDLYRAQLSDQDLSGQDLGQRDLTGADLRRANLAGACLRGACLVDADLGGADLGGADLAGADLTYADLEDADLAGADLSGADLSATRLTRAVLQGARVTGARFTSSRGLSPAARRDLRERGARLSGGRLRATLSAAIHRHPAPALALALLAAVALGALGGARFTRQRGPSTLYPLAPPRGAFLYQVNCGAHNDQPFSRTHGYFHGRKFRSKVAPATIRRVALAPREAYLSDHRGREFSYLFYTPPGWFEVELHFVELEHTRRGDRTFEIQINGRQVASELDILALARPRQALVRRWAVYAGGSGITLLFLGRQGQAKVNFIRIRPLDRSMRLRRR